MLPPAPHQRGARGVRTLPTNREDTMNANTANQLLARSLGASRDGSAEPRRSNGTSGGCGGCTACTRICSPTSRRSLAGVNPRRSNVHRLHRTRPAGLRPRDRRRQLHPAPTDARGRARVRGGASCSDRRRVPCLRRPSARRGRRRRPRWAPPDERRRLAQRAAWADTRAARGRDPLQRIPDQWAARCTSSRLELDERDNATRTNVTRLPVHLRV